VSHQHPATLPFYKAARCRWLKPVILVTQKAEIRRIVVQIVHETLSQKKTHHKKGLVEWLKV
jgi:hypothetical protein